MQAIGSAGRRRRSLARVASLPQGRRTARIGPSVFSASPQRAIAAQALPYPGVLRVTARTVRWTGILTGAVPARPHV